MYKKVIIFLILAGLIAWAWQLEQKRLAEEELKEKIGQMLMVGFRGADYFPNSAVKEMIQEVKPGGLILFDYDVPSQSRPRNISDPTQLKSLIANLQEISGTPLFVAVDAEGGAVNRLKEDYGFLNIPSHQALGKNNSPEQTKETIGFLAQELKLLGFNLDFAPVIDLNINPANPVIGKLERSFSADPQIVTDQAEAFIAALHDYDIIASLKHFPGHGSSQNDSHLGLIDITESWSIEELIPYQNIINDGLADIVMTAHIINKKVDPELPATLSPLFIQNILRQQLKFDGVVISDDMQMKAITENFGFKESIIKAVRAGCDMLIFSNNGEIYDENIALKARDIIFKAVQNNEIPMESINQSFQRIQALKQKFKVIDKYE